MCLLFAVQVMCACDARRVCFGCKLCAPKINTLAKPSDQAVQVEVATYLVPDQTLDELDSKVKAIKHKFPNPQNPNFANAVKLYLYISGNTPKVK